MDFPRHWFWSPFSPILVWHDASLLGIAFFPWHTGIKWTIFAPECFAKFQFLIWLTLHPDPIKSDIIMLVTSSNAKYIHCTSLPDAPGVVCM